MKRPALALGAALLALALAATCDKTAPTAPQSDAADEALSLAKMGYFYVGGADVQKPDRLLKADAMFVEYFLPAKQTQPTPLVFVHGGSSTGATFLGTPDDREGWAEFFLRRGYAVYVVDQPTRGRSGYDADTDGPLERAPGGSAERMFTATEKFNLWPQAKLHNQFPGEGVPGDPIFDRYAASAQPSIGGGVRMDTINRDALAALLDRIGPAVLVTHSRSGPMGWLAADARPGKVKAIIAVEPNGPAFRNAGGAASANAPPSGEDRPWGVTYERMTFEPAVSNPAELTPKEEKPEGPDLIGCWRASGPKRTLKNLVGVPILILTSEAGYHAQYDQCTAHFLSDFGVANEHVRLEQRGIHGNGHLLMVEKNNLEIAALIDEWLKAKLTASK